jgi:uncharacterized lipoprotein YajG
MFQMPFLIGLVKHWRVGLVALLLTASFAGGYKVAALKYNLKIESAKAAMLEAAQEQQKLNDAIEEAHHELSDALAKVYELENRKQETVFKEVIKEVVKYVQTDNARECGLSPSGVYIHDTAATGELPEDTDTTTSADDGTIEATNAEIIQVVTDNYTTCNSIRQQLINLQRWAAGISG